MTLDELIVSLQKIREKEKGDTLVVNEDRENYNWDKVDMVIAFTSDNKGYYNYSDSYKSNTKFIGIL